MCYHCISFVLCPVLVLSNTGFLVQSTPVVYSRPLFYSQVSPLIMNLDKSVYETVATGAPNNKIIIF